eukprot:TRINITY_DN7613_c0_g1_i3.p1 TRINITY_DN7613_c0_g1~~TRINITY_DN7613_c0_g1_i3.p1  ORF type:complete len:1196 (+),score=318.62 TRINITY_DN7613_c0_g1_i3:86-3673(+)
MGVFGALVLAAASVSTLHHIGADDNPDHDLAHWRQADLPGRRHFLVKFAPAVAAGRRRAAAPSCGAVAAHLEERGGRAVPCDVVPPNGHVVYTDLETLRAATRWDLTWLREVLPERKMAPGLWNWESPADVDGRAKLVVTAAEAVNVSAVVTARGVAVDVDRVELVSAERGERHVLTLRRHGDVGRAARALAQHDAVRWVEHTHHTRRGSPLNVKATWTMQTDGTLPRGTNPKDMEHPLWDRGLDGTGELALVGDSGLDYDSCYFHDPDQDVAIYPKANYAHRKVVSYVPDLLNEAGDVGDEMRGHGTHVSGSLMGHSLNDHDAGQFNGLAKGAKMAFADFANHRNFELPLDMRTYYAQGASLGAKVSHNSWGGDTAPQVVEGTELETDYFMWHNQGFTGVYAAGNRRNYGILKPASAKNGIGVGSHTNAVDESLRENLSDFSAIGPTYDGRQKPDVVAPGGGVFSSTSDGDLASQQCDGESKSGTSMAAPFVSASVLLVRQYLREGYYPSGARDAAAAINHPAATLLKGMIVHSGRAMSGRMIDRSDGRLPERTQGFGRVSLPQVLYFADGYSGDRPAGTDNPLPRSLFLLNNATVDHDEELVYCFKVGESPQTQENGPDGFKVTLVWHDPPAAAGSKKSMINDVDLLVQLPTGEMVYANSLAGLEDNNNVEQVHVPAFVKGVYRVFVVGHDIREVHPYAAQPFSLVVTAPELALYGEDGACPAEPSVVTADNGAPLPCPFDCSGRGACGPDGLCSCKDGFFHVGCTQCSDYHHCHNRGSCKPDTTTCHCIKEAFGEECEQCRPGWFGPGCTSDCRCLHGGTCDEATGGCTCLANEEAGFWTGAKCERCAEGYRGDDCKTKSHWCKNNAHVVVTDTEGWIQVDSRKQYANGMTCKWYIVPESPDAKIEFQFVDITIEKEYDFVQIFQGATMNDKEVFKKDGHSGPQRVTSRGPTLVVFTSDHLGPDAGFNLYYTVATKPTPQPTEATPQPTEATPQPTEATPQPTEATPQPTEATPQPTEATPQPTEATPQPTEATLQPTEATPQPTEATPQPTEATPQPTEATPQPTEATPHPTDVALTREPIEVTPEPTLTVAEPGFTGTPDTLVPAGTDVPADHSREILGVVFVLVLALIGVGAAIRYYAKPVGTARDGKEPVTMPTQAENIFDTGSDAEDDSHRKDLGDAGHVDEADMII